MEALVISYELNIRLTKKGEEWSPSAYKGIKTRYPLNYQKDVRPKAVNPNDQNKTQKKQPVTITIRFTHAHGRSLPQDSHEISVRFPNNDAYVDSLPQTNVNVAEWYRYGSSERNSGVVTEYNN